MDVLIVVQLIVNGLLMGGVYAVVAVGLTLIFGVMNVVNFAHGEFVMLGMVLTYLIHTFIGLDPGVSILLVIPVMFGVGAFIQKTLITRVVGQSDEGLLDEGSHSKHNRNDQKNGYIRVHPEEGMD